MLLLAAPWGIDKTKILMGDCGEVLSTTGSILDQNLFTSRVLTLFFMFPIIKPL